MIYELCLVTRPETDEEKLGKIFEMVKATLKDFEGEVLIEDDWGTKTFAQPTADGLGQGHFTYFIFKANNMANTELARRFGIEESVLKHLIVKLGEEADQDKAIKVYKTPFSKRYHGSIADEDEGEGKDKDQRRFSRRKACWFSAKGISPNWKDPKTFSWLVNEFGKISPARVSGVSRKNQRLATSAIKQARQLGIASYISNEIAE